MQHHGVAGGEVGDLRADGLHPAGVLVPDHQRQLHGDDAVEPPLDDVQVGAAEPRPTDADDDVERSADLGRRDLVELQRGVEGVQSCCLHLGLPSCPPTLNRSSALAKRIDNCYR